MKKYQYSVNYHGTIEVFADSDDEAQNVAAEQLPPDAVIVDWEKCENDPSGGDGE